jgi:hypothetical protein
LNYLELMPIEKRIIHYINNFIQENMNTRIVKITTNSNISLLGYYQAELHSYEIITFSDLSSNKYTDNNLKFSGGTTFSLLPLKDIVSMLAPTSVLLTVLSTIIPSTTAINYQKQFKPIINGLKVNRTKAKTYKKMTRIIIVEDYNKLSDKEFDLLKTISYFIQAKQLLNIGIIIQCSEEEKWDTSLMDIPSENFDITMEDLNFLTSNEIIFKPYVLQLAQKLGIPFFEKYSDIIIRSIQASDEDYDTMLQKIVDKMLAISHQQSQIDQGELDNFLKYCSLFINSFTKFDIEDVFDEKSLNFLNPALQAKVLDNQQEDTYLFMEEAIKLFFYNRARREVPSQIVGKLYKHINKNYPYEYIYLAHLVEMFSRDREEIISAYIVAYCYTKKEGLFQQRLQLLSAISKYSPEYRYLECIEMFRDHTSYEINMIKEMVESLLNNAKLSSLTVLAKLCFYCSVAIYYYEHELNQSVLENLHNEIFVSLNQLNENNCNNLPYWKNEFNMNLILLTTVLKNPYSKAKRNAQKSIGKMIEYFELHKEKEMKNYLKLLRLGNAIYPEDIEKGMLFTEKAFTLSMGKEDWVVDHELSKINYSYSLIYLGQYSKAFELLKAKPSIDLSLINQDTQLSFKNNYWVAGRLSNRFSLPRVIKEFNGLLKEAGNSNSSDVMIIRNNAAAALLKNNHEKAIEMLEYVISHGDSYHQFYALHNLLSFYFEAGDVDNYNHTIIKIKASDDPLIQPFQSFFNDKFQIMLLLMKEELTFTEKENRLLYIMNERYPSPGYAYFKNLILYGGIERWFE